MRRALILLVAVAACLGLPGCGKNFMQPPSPNFTVEQSAPDKAQIVFLRATSTGWDVSAPILEVADGTLQFITRIRIGTKFLHTTTPGKHQYLIDGEFGYFMDAELEAGKTYYAYITTRMGWWGGRRMFTPVAAGELTSEKFRADFAWCDWRENAPEGEQWFIQEKMRLEQRYSSLIQRKSAEGWADAAKMRPEYGVSVPVR